MAGIIQIVKDLQRSRAVSPGLVIMDGKKSRLWRVIAEGAPCDHEYYLEDEGTGECEHIDWRDGKALTQSVNNAW